MVVAYSNNTEVFEWKTEVTTSVPFHPISHQKVNDCFQFDMQPLDLFPWPSHWRMSCVLFCILLSRIRQYTGWCLLSMSAPIRAASSISAAKSQAPARVLFPLCYSEHPSLLFLHFSTQPSSCSYVVTMCYWSLHYFLPMSFRPYLPSVLVMSAVVTESGPQPTPLNIAHIHMVWMSARSYGLTGQHIVCTVGCHFYWKLKA